MNIHNPRHHTIAIGVLGAGLVGSMIYGLIRVDQLPLTPVYSISQGDVDKLPFGQHPYAVFGADGAGRLPQELVAALRKAGDAARYDDDLLPHAGIWVSPDTPEGHDLADAISHLIGEPVKVGNADGGAYEIGIGRPLEPSP